MKKILILANNDVGLYKFRKELIQELLKKYEVYISLPEGEFITHLRELGCKFINTEINRRGTNPISDLKLFSKYRKIISGIRPDVVLTYTIKPNIYGGIACRLSKSTYITNITGLGSAVENKGLLQKIILMLYKLSMRKANTIFFQNKENENFFIKNKLIYDKYKLIPGSGVNLHYYNLLEYPPDQEINFLFIARIMKEKGIDQYLEAAEYIKYKYPNTVFHVLGECEEAYENKLNNMEKNGIIKYHGMQSDVRKFHRKSHCTIHPTYYPEGMSNVLLESAACGRPIITTDRSGCREIVDHGVNGYIIEEKNSQALINTIENFLKLNFDEKKKMGLAGRSKIEKEFDRKIVIGEYCETIQKIISNN
ncbi:glycosyltransferase family 4 protein [Paenibacillus odorifer]|uniref:glycosyltransferase family 4 protein n=1 Tax=Paenibacillus odorifer TaxID=189426 RepID=UPI000BA00BCD|nr:glycosyltransferase family 4 protein [Paenibacillus odorifer]OZQ71154.1 glycosyltransferase family 1 protein [Paenibacillus odorifer]